MATTTDHDSPGKPLRRLALLVIVVAFIGGGFAIAYFHASAANDNAARASIHAAKVAQCVNNVLRARDVIAGQQHAADVDRVKAQKQAEKVKAAAEKVKAAALDGLLHASGPLGKLRAFNDYRRGEALFTTGEALFTKTLDAYLARTDQLRKAQLAHPLGRCK